MFTSYNTPFSSPGKSLILNCPENSKQQFPCITSIGELYTSYTANGWGNVADGTGVGHPFGGSQSSNWSFPSELCLLWEGTYFRYQNPWCDTGTGTVPAVSVGASNTRYPHRLSSNVLYGDGHVSPLFPVRGVTSWLGGGATKASAYSNGNFWYCYK